MSEFPEWVEQAVPGIDTYEYSLAVHHALLIKELTPENASQWRASKCTACDIRWACHSVRIGSGSDEKVYRFCRECWTTGGFAKALFDALKATQP